MLKSYLTKKQQGFSLFEILISLVILGFGILGLANLQSKLQLSDIETYQRSQAILILSDMANRLKNNASNASDYVSTDPIGTGDEQLTTCTSLSGADRDICEWSNILKGASEDLGSDTVGAMKDARGCITQIQTPDSTKGICTPGIYQIDVAWQGMLSTTTPTNTCGQGSYGDDESFRKVISSQITIGLPSCL